MRARRPVLILALGLLTAASTTAAEPLGTCPANTLFWASEPCWCPHGTDRQHTPDPRSDICRSTATPGRAPPPRCRIGRRLPLSHPCACPRGSHELANDRSFICVPGPAPRPTPY